MLTAIEILMVSAAVLAVILLAIEAFDNGLDWLSRRGGLSQVEQPSLRLGRRMRLSLVAFVAFVALHQLVVETLLG